jgi:hypothetical protein
MTDCFVPARILLPEKDTALDPWAVIAVDQFTSQPEYWQKAEKLAQGKPSTLHIVLPEAYLGGPEEAARTENIRKAMHTYRKSVLTRCVNGFVYVERTQQDGTVRQGLVGAVDLEAYSYDPAKRLPIRPSESTVVSRIPPRLKVRRGAELETPHVMMLADDDGCTLIEPVGQHKAELEKLYEGELMLGGGHIAAWAVEDPAMVHGVQQALQALASPEAFAKKYPEAAGQEPMVLAVGDGNHSLATAKAYWEELKPTLTEEQRQNHPARWCLAEVCNVHSPAIEIEPIHRALFGTSAASVLARLSSYAQDHGIEIQRGTDACQTVRLYSSDCETAIGLEGDVEPLTVGTVEKFITWYLHGHPMCRVDYIHGVQAAKDLARHGAVALILPDLQKADLFRGVVLGGVLPRKTFSMGHAEEKRYYIECRSLAPD